MEIFFWGKGIFGVEGGIRNEDEVEGDSSFESQVEQRFLVGSFNLDKLCLVKCWRRHLGGVRRLA